MGKTTFLPPFSPSPSQSQRRQASKSGWFQDLCAKRAKIRRHFNARTFLSKCNLWGKEGTTFACCHHQLCTFQTGQASHSPSRALPPTLPNPVYAPSDSRCPQCIGWGATPSGLVSPAAKRSGASNTCGTSSRNPCSSRPGLAIQGSKPTSAT